MVMESRSAEPPADEPAGAGEPRALRVLIIDDEQPVRAALNRYFTRKGWVAEGVGDANEALKLLRTKPPDAFDVVLSDMSMPGMGGTALHDALRDEYPGYFRRLIITTGDVASPEALALRERSDRPFVAKPFDFSALMEMVTSVAHGER